MRIRLSSEARRDLIAIGDFIARDDPFRAISFVKELTDKCAGLADMPLSFQLVPRYEKKGIRRRVHGNYQIFYRVDGELIYVLRVLHGARDYEALL
jgi:plasmid stabilization system protein ParE